MPRRRATFTHEPDPIDLHIGQRIRQRRLVLRLTQTSIAERLGVSFQAVQKYEAGVVRVAASTLWRIARALGVSLDYFVAEQPGEETSSARPKECDEWIAERTGSSAPVKEEEWVALRALKPLMALPSEVRDEVVSHIRGLARVLSKN
jgi:transcriptional regulator with XRE-family HTH domain